MLDIISIIVAVLIGYALGFVHARRAIRDALTRVGDRRVRELDRATYNELAPPDRQHSAYHNPPD